MSLEIFERMLRQRCKNSYADLKTGKREIRLQKERINVRAMKDLVKGKIDEADLEESCLRTFGDILQDTATEYAKSRGAKIYSGKVGTIEIDNLIDYNGTVYNFESKASINLDKGKSRETKAEIHDKTKVTRHSTRNERQVVSGIIVWTKAREEDARKLAKPSLRTTKMFGYIDFFQIFDVIITEGPYKEMIRSVWAEEVKALCILNKNHGENQSKLEVQ